MKVRMMKFGLTGVAAALAVAAFAPPVQAQDFFSNLFGGLSRSRAPVVQMPFGDNFQQSAPRQRVGGGGQAYCVRTCDGRYFPVAGNDNDGREKACSSLCPTADTKVVYGSSIDGAATENGKPYTKLPNAFRYRDEIVAGCTCNGKDSGGLARIEPENDPTLRKGDVVAGAHGLVVASKTSDRRGASVQFSPASERIKDRYRAPPVVAKGRD